MDPGLSLELLRKNYSSPGVVKLNDYGLGIAENPAVTMRGASFQPKINKKIFNLGSMRVKDGPDVLTTEE